MLYRNKKNGNLYEIICEGIDCTNSRDGTEVFMYHQWPAFGDVYVREKEEFYEKFEAIH